MAAVTAIGVFLGLLGPFGSFYSGPAWQRIAYWTSTAWLGAAVFGGGAALILGRLGARPAGWAALAGYTLVICAPFALAVWFAATAIWPALRSTPHLTPAAWYLQCLAIAAPQVALLAVLRARRPKAGGEPMSPLRLPGDVLCLQMEDHYVRVHTARGSRLVLGTLNQATAALAGARGLRVHRSWWVAEKAVASVVMDGRNLRLVLINGLTAPVARSAVAAVRAAGWLEGGPSSLREDQERLEPPRLFG